MSAQVSSFVLGGLFYILGALVLVATTLVGVICTTCSDLIKQEAATRLERLPLWLLRRAARGLPEECREEILATEWVPELLHISRESEGLPLTRLVRSVKFATNLLGGPAATVGKLLKPIRASELPRPRDSDQADKLDLIPVPWVRRLIARVLRRSSPAGTTEREGERIPAPWMPFELPGGLRHKCSIRLSPRYEGDTAMYELRFHPVALESQSITGDKSDLRFDFVFHDSIFQVKYAHGEDPPAPQADS
ncbi:hypothetical protein [Nonomuraea recticatena]|uniref:Uncharacterized protein n=1 Tax=Nonomuraea recticatena TaxID=46178 RepID=A0ABP6FHN5_9ACTN